MRKKYRSSHPFILSFLAVAIVLFAFNFSVEAQASIGNTNKASESPTPAPTPIPVGNVVAQSEMTANRLERIKEGLSQSPNVAVIEMELPGLKDDLDSRRAETERLLSANPSLETLRTIEQEWQALAKNPHSWNDDLKAQITVLDTYLKELRSLRQEWQKTLESVGISPESETPGNATPSPETETNANEDRQISAIADVPDEILEKIRNTIASIENTQAQIEESRGKLLTLQTVVNREETRIKETLQSVSDVRAKALTNLFVKDSPAIWNAHRNTDTVGGLFTEAGDSYSAQIGALSEYAQRKSGGFVLHGIVFLIFFGVFIWARKRLRPMVEADAELKPAFSVFEMPFAAALILSIMLSGSFYPQAPRMLAAILGGAALVPGIIYLRRIIERPLFPILNALVIFYFIDLIRQITAALPLLSRILFIAEMLGAIFFLIWFVRSRNLSKGIEARHQRIFVVIKKIIPFLLVVFSLAFIGNSFGYVSLSTVIGNGFLASSYAALILYTAIQLVKSLIIFALRVPPLNNLGMVKTNHEKLKNKIFDVLKWLGIIIWGILTLNVFSIRETVFGFFKEWLTAELIMGSIAISLADVITFCFAVWLAFALSKLIRFILEEDIYPRVNLAGGVPYAISTMVHYTVLVVGFFLAIAALGIDLTKFTILAGAFGVGLGFGLQNIVNNFVSGLILLFERPVKVNDFVQVGTHVGDLKRIGLRASVLRSLDGSEIIVPNGQLISEEVTNWTLSDQQRRFEINVGVAYGSKPRQVMDLLIKLAADNEDILDEPAPQSIFVGFGDNSLDFQLRAWTEKVGWVVVRSDLTLAIHESLDEAGIEIPFPQRDLHVRSIDQNVLETLRDNDKT